MSERQPLNVETLLRSRWGRAGLVLLVVLIVSYANAVPRFEMAELRFGDPNRAAIFTSELLGWGVWGLACWPIFAIARWSLAASRSWLVFFLLQLALSGLGGWGYLELDQALRREFEPALVSSGEERPGRQGDGRWAEGRNVDNRELEERPVEGRTGERPRGPAETQGERSGRWPGDRFGRRRGGRGGDTPDWRNPFWRYRWMQAVLVYWVALGMGAGLYSFLSLRDKERRAADFELRAEKLRAELARTQVGTLRNQLNPHFLFNALHSVGGLVRAGEEGPALRTLAAIGELLRSTLDQGDHEEVPLKEELRLAERFLDIEKIRLGERLSVSIDMNESLQDALVPSLLLLPLVENAVRHGIAPLPEGGVVRVHAEREGSNLVLTVSDDGRGFPLDVLRQNGSKETKGRRSIGLENTRERLLALYGTSHQFELSNLDPSGACVRLVLPYRKAASKPPSGIDSQEDPS